jgi:hypothetical protein
VGAIVRQALHGIGRSLAEWRHGGVIEVNQLVADEKFAGEAFTKIRAGGRVCILNKGHFIYNTLKWPEEPL